MNFTVKLDFTKAKFNFDIMEFNFTVKLDFTKGKFNFDIIKYIFNLTLNIFNFTKEIFKIKTKIEIYKIHTHI